MTNPAIDIRGGYDILRRGLVHALTDLGFDVQHPDVDDASMTNDPPIVIRLESTDSEREQRATVLDKDLSEAAAVIVMIRAMQPAEAARILALGALPMPIDVAMPALRAMIDACQIEHAVLPFSLARELGEAAQTSIGLISLSREQSTLLNLLAEGRRIDEIATALDRHERTVFRWTGKLYDRLGVTDRVAAVAVAREHGLIAS